jgi:hypothetical protein
MRSSPRGRTTTPWPDGASSTVSLTPKARSNASTGATRLSVTPAARVARPGSPNRRAASSTVARSGQTSSMVATVTGPASLGPFRDFRTASAEITVARSSPTCLLRRPCSAAVRSRIPAEAGSCQRPADSLLDRRARPWYSAATVTIRLQAVKFLHGPAATRAGALRLRRNAARTIEVPEWRDGLGGRHADSVAAYAINRTRTTTITIQAALALTRGGMRSAEVRAVPRTLPPPPWWLEPGVAALSPGAAYVLASWYARFLAALAAGAAGDALGGVDARTVTFRSDGTTGFQTFELTGSTLSDRGVGVQDVTWRWQYRPGDSEPWRDFAESRHRIYAVLDRPTRPWLQTRRATETQLPWTEVLEYACRWAAGARTGEEAATLVTLAVNALGNGLIEYGCPILGLSQYSLPFFNCTALLERLRGGIGNGPFVNCTDCATIVSTFANVLGCDLWQSKMAGAVPFSLNAIRAIGSRSWQLPCGWAAFSYHEVAWKNRCTASDEVFDACLHVDGDLDPTRPPHTALLPTNIRFGHTGEGLYRDRLAAPPGRMNCAPQPSTRERRLVI